MVKIVAATCPRCGANIDLPSDLRKAHCVYCGASIIIGADGSQKAECRICDGYGRLEKCRACDGTGVCRWARVADQVADTYTATFHRGGEAHCDHGMCSACGGKGVTRLNLSCHLCSGTGYCPQCYGTGKCIACGGVGMSPNPKGSEICYMCHGDGLVEIEKADVKWGERCPVCRMSHSSEGSFCAYCGYARKCPKCGAAWPDQKDHKCVSCGYERGTKP